MSAGCWMCERDADADARTFYDRDGWFAVLAVPPHVRGHAVLARTAGAGCPQGLDEETLAGLEHALSGVVALLKRHYPDIKNVLVASLRAKDPHVHLHLIPIWPRDEAEWRTATGHASGHMFTFLGDLEKMALARAENERARRGWTDADLRAHYTATCQSDRDGLVGLAASEGIEAAGRPTR